MRARILLALACAALGTAALALAPAGGATGASVAKKCVKKHHFHSRAAKRRHKRRCAKRNAGVPGSGGGADAPCTNTSSSPGRLAVQEDELDATTFSMKLSRTAVDCEEVIVEQQNIGMDPHDLVLQKAGSAGPSYFYPSLAPGGVARQTVSLSRGTWVLYCDLPGHRDGGMVRSLVVD
jgi:hypothetical protein